MRKICTLILVIIVTFLFGCGGCSCKNYFTTELKEIENEVTLSIKEDYIPYLGYQENDIPIYTFKFEGKINTALRTTGPHEVVFTGNDDFRISEMVKELLKYHEENGIISYRSLGITKKYETHLNKKTIDSDGNEKTEKVYLKVIDGNMYDEIAYITLDNGLQLTINYRRFDVEGENGETITYYGWQYTESIRMILYYPLMVVEELNGEKKILIVALPNAVINKIETRYDVEGLMTKDTYLDSSYYTYPYPDYDSETSGSDYDATNSINSIKEYYTKFYNGRIENDEFVYTYLGYDFKVTFEKTSFIITYIPR